MYARGTFRLQEKSEGGAPAAAHLRQLAKSRGKHTDAYVEDFLGVAECPYELRWIWGVFLDINRTRVAGFSAPNAISFSDIRAWSELYNTRLLPWEVDTLRSLDSVALEVMRDFAGSRKASSPHRKP